MIREDILTFVIKRHDCERTCAKCAKISANCCASQKYEISHKV